MVSISDSIGGINNQTMNVSVSPQNITLSNYL